MIEYNSANFPIYVVTNSSKLINKFHEIKRTNSLLIENQFEIEGFILLINSQIEINDEFRQKLLNEDIQFYLLYYQE